MTSKSGANGEIKKIENEKRHEIQPLKMDTLTVSIFDAFIHVRYMTNQNITSVTDLHRGDIVLHSAYKIDYH